MHYESFLIIFAHSARALAESATRLGYQVITVDGFADTDTREVCHECWCLPLQNGEFVDSKIRCVINKLHQTYPHAKVLLGAGAEFITLYVKDVVGWSLCGNSQEVIQKAVEPKLFFKELQALGIPFPESQYKPPQDTQEYLCKIPGKCGGAGVFRAACLNHYGYWQKEIAGVALSALCATDTVDYQLIGINQQFSKALSPELPYMYQGAMANYEIEDNYIYKINSYLKNIIYNFKIIGVFSLDLILNEQQLFVLEINPRVSATYELYEQINPNVNLVDAHIRLCEGERLSDLRLRSNQCAYRVVYADQDFTVPEQIQWPHWVKDKPEPLRLVRCNEPICTVHSLDSKDPIRLVEQRENEILRNL